MQNPEENVTVYGHSVHPDVLDTLRDEARLNVKELVSGGDVARSDEEKAVDREVKRLLYANP